MQPAALPADEQARLEALHSLNILDTPPEERFDRLTRIARRMFAVPIAQVSLIDTRRQWIKSSAGLPAAESPREAAFCAHTILGNDVFQIEDATEDARFSDNPLVVGDPSIRFYAGCPLRFGNHNLGALCLIDRAPRKLTDDERQLLFDLARMAEEELASEHLASTDALTGLANRRGFENIAAQVLAVCRRSARPATLVFFDLDRFKPINDTYGHSEGDRALRIFAAELDATFRESDVAARLGGDEFAVLLTGSSLSSAVGVLARLRAALAARVREERLPYVIECSAGSVAFDPARHATVGDLLAQADAAMYREKSQRR